MVNTAALLSVSPQPQNPPSVVFCVCQHCSCALHGRVPLFFIPQVEAPFLFNNIKQSEPLGAGGEGVVSMEQIRGNSGPLAGRTWPKQLTLDEK